MVANSQMDAESISLVKEYVNELLRYVCRAFWRKYTVAKMFICRYLEINKDRIFQREYDTPSESYGNTVRSWSVYVINLNPICNLTVTHLLTKPFACLNSAHCLGGTLSLQQLHACLRSKWKAATTHSPLGYIYTAQRRGRAECSVNPVWVPSTK